MLIVNVPELEIFDSKVNEFTTMNSFTLTLEHSLASVSKWETRWLIPFLGDKPKTEEETIDYIRCMIIESTGPSPSEITLAYLPEDIVLKISAYIDEPMTATTFAKGNGKPNREIITNELVYYWMISQNVPFECETWHLNRLLTLINVCVIKNSPAKKMGVRDIMSRNASLNASRKKALNTTG